MTPHRTHTMTNRKTVSCLHLLLTYITLQTILLSSFVIIPTPQKYEPTKLIIYQNISYFSVFMLFNNLILKVKFHFQREKRYKIKVRVYCSSSKELKVGGRVNQFSIIGWSRQDQALCQESLVIQCYFKNRHGQINNKITNLVNILIIFLRSQYPYTLGDTPASTPTLTPCSIKWGTFAWKYLE